MKVGSVSNNYQKVQQKNNNQSFGHVIPVFVKVGNRVLPAQDKKTATLIMDKFVAGLHSGKKHFRKLAKIFGLFDSDFGKTGEISHFSLSPYRFFATGHDSRYLITSELTTGADCKKIFNKEISKKNDNPSVIANLVSNVKNRIRGVVGYVIEAEEVPRKGTTEPSYKIKKGYFIIDKPNVSEAVNKNPNAPKLQNAKNLEEDYLKKRIIKLPPNSMPPRTPQRAVPLTTKA